MNKMRHPGVEPYQAMAGMGDHPSAVALYGSVMTALFKRERTGKGSKVHTSLMANGLWSASCFAQAAWADADFSQIPVQRLTTALYLTSDQRWLQFSMVRKEEDFDRLLLALGHPEWLADERFATQEARIENFETCTQMMRDVIAQRTAAEWMTLLTEQGVPVALVAEFEDLPTDQQLIANHMTKPAGDDVGMAQLIRDPINVDGEDRVAARRAPEMGEHSTQILGELGYDEAEITQMRDNGVI